MSASSSNPSRKIDIQSSSDLAHLIDVAQSASASKLAAAFPVSASADPENPDIVRAQVAALLDKFLEETYVGVRKNVLVNGVPADGSGISQDGGNADMTMMEEDYETFDTGLAERIRTLEEKKEVLTERIAELRRTGPSKAADKWKSDWEADRELDSVKQEGDGTAEQLANIGTEEIPELLDVEKPARWEEVQRTYSRALDGLLALKTGMAGTVGNLEEAKRVSESLHSAAS